VTSGGAETLLEAVGVEVVVAVAIEGGLVVVELAMSGGTTAADDVAKLVEVGTLTEGGAMVDVGGAVLVAEIP